MKGIEYYCGKEERISTMKLCFHNILHTADSIENTGPCLATWQFPMERVCGMLVPLARSRFHPYKNIINNIYIWELFNYLQFYQTIHTKIFSSQQINKNEKRNVFSQDGVNEEFYYPSNLSMYGTKFGRLLTKDGHFIGSKWIKKNKDWARTNYSVLAIMEVDKWAAYLKRPPEFILQKFYGNIEYYLTYEFEGKVHMLAYIHWTTNITPHSTDRQRF
ncbi:uncharacterized protein OCT59_009759 [Rhizophagus irregularis]|uniref:uncharacterized protein n=1 Tax=Rhizophagus irregularis TaxID=588596 RepID=UPI0033173B65|nr:hypothetical protein OCT59_009759 [Rhizophagus irregularis]